MSVPPVELHIVSDATGETATRLVAALEAQFPEQPFEEVRHPRVETVDDLRLVVDRAKGRPAVVVYTIVEPELREAMRDFCRRAKLHYCDILGPPLASIAKISGRAAKMAPGVRHPLDSAYFRRIGAIEFAVKYDDGMGSGLREADIVLVGVSRTSKTPLSMYLGYMGYKTANVPIVSGIEVPPDLFEIDASKIVGLTIDANAPRRDPAGARPAHGREPAARTRSWTRSTTSSSRRTRSTAGWAAPCWTSPSSRSRRPPRAWSSSSRTGSERGHEKRSRASRSGAGCSGGSSTSPGLSSSTSC